MRWKLNSDWTNLLNYGSYEIVTKYYSVIFGSNFVDAKLGWIVINCRFIICKGSADQWRLFERGIKRGISMSANPLSAQPHRAGLPHQSPNWHPTTPLQPPSLMSSGCVFPISFCVFCCRYCSAAREPTDWRRYFWINFCYLWILGRHDMVIIVSLVPLLGSHGVNLFRPNWWFIIDQSKCIWSDFGVCPA